MWRSIDLHIIVLTIDSNSIAHTPQNKRVEIYSADRDVEILENPIELFGEDILPGFMLNLSRVLN